MSLTPSQFLLPGLIDTHIHASQFPNAGLALDLTLLDWLEKYTFPTEEGFRSEWSTSMSSLDPSNCYASSLMP